MDVQFQLPLSRNDLLSSNGEHYSVDEVFSVRELVPKLEESLINLKENGPTGILSEFDSIFSVIVHFKEVSSEIKEKTWVCIYKAVLQHVSELAMVIDPEGMDFQVQKVHINTVKMLAYLLTQLMEAFEAEATKPSVSVDEARKSRGRPASKKAVVTGWDWDMEKNDGLRAIGQLIGLDVRRLWDPPVVEGEFVDLFSSVCYKFLENATVSRVKATKESIFHIIGTLIKKYDHGLSASLKIIQLLQHFDHLVVPLAQGVEVFVAEFGSQRIVGDIIREIGRMDPADLSRDSSGTRSFSQFMVEIANRQPSLVLPNISLLLSHLDGDSYTMRNAVLGVIGEIVIKVLSKNDLDPNLKNTRDKFLDRLEEHLHDSHAFVRSKVLQIWHNICDKKAIPLDRLGSLVDLVIGRLHDKSSQVRKYSVQLLKALLHGNPYAAKLPIEELKKKLEKEQDILDGLISKHTANSNKWEEVAPYLSDALTDASGECADCGIKIEEDADVEEVIESILHTFYKNIADGRYREAVAVYKMAERRWPMHFSAGESNEDNEASQTPGGHEGVNSQVDEKEPEMDVAAFGQMEVKRKMNLFEAIFKKLDEAYSPLKGVAQTEEDGSELPSSPEPEELTEQRVVVRYREDSLRFAIQMQKAIKIVCQLLGSKISSDILETIEFFVSANEFGLEDIEHGTRKMLALVWSRDNAVKEAVVRAYRKLYIETCREDQRNLDWSILQNLTSLTYGATLGELTSLEELLIELYKMMLIPPSVLQLLWQRFSLKSPQTTPMESRSAILLLGMFAGAETSIVKSNIDILVEHGLGPRAHQDFLLAFNTCTALLKLLTKKRKPGESEEEPFRFPHDHQIFGKLEEILVRGLHRTEVSSWSALSLQAVNVIYKLAEHPDKICARLIRTLVKTLLQAPSASKFATQDESEEKEESPESNSPQDGEEERSQNLVQNSACQPKVLARVLFVVGHIAFQQLVHLDVSILSELKRRHRIQEEEKEEKQVGQRGNNGSQSLETETTKETVEESLEDELGIGGAAAEDAEAEFIRSICEKDVITGQNLLALFGPLLTAICSNPSKYADEELRASACLALSKFMLVSSEFCDANLQLLFTILEKSKEPIIRANTIIALGDLTFRFPNLIEPWTSHLYARLSDDSVKVRQTTVTVLTHLILNDMVKVKGQISEMAFCLEDKEKRIADLAKLFFTEFSQKGNSLYNVLPDIISRLSEPECGADEAKFQSIMEYLLQFIQKDKQSEALVEKLCHRFRVTSTPRQWHDLAYCLSQLPFNEKCFKKLQDNFVCFQESLSDQQVYDCFNSIISKSKKFIKQDLKVIVEEFEEKVTVYHKKAVDDEAGFEHAAKASEKASTRKVKQKNDAGENKRKTRKQIKMESDGSEQEKENRELITPKKSKKISTSKSTARKGKVKKPMQFIDDEDDEIEWFG